MSIENCTPGDWEVGQHPATSKGWIIRPVLFGFNTRKMPESEGGAVLILNQADAHMLAASKRMHAALEAILPYIPKSTASEGGANRHAGNVIAADMVRAAIASARCDL